MSIARIISALQNLRTDFGRGRAAAKKRWLDRAARQPIDDPQEIREYHDLLLYMAAHPDNHAVRRRVDRELRHVADSVLKASPRRLADSGIANTSIESPFSLDMTRWLTGRFGKSVAVVWDKEGSNEALDDFLENLIASVERDGLYCERLSTCDWLRLAAGRSPSALRWLVERFDALPCSTALRSHAFDALEMSFRWMLKGRDSSRTFVRFPPRGAFWQATKIHRKFDVLAGIARELPTPDPLPVSKARALLAACRATLCVRRREIDTLTYANEREVYLLRLDRGVDVAVFGMTPDRRLPIESYFGYVVARNRVPIGYGGGWGFFDRCEIGVNIFDEFRGGESAFAFVQVLRAYRQLFRPAYFTVDPYQFGAGNTEAIQSGAFWFYYRLGFRPIDAKIATLAEEEYARLSSSRSYRSKPAALRRLAGAKLRMDLGSSKKSVPEIIDIGLAVTDWIGRRFRGDGRAAEAWAAKCLFKRGSSRWLVDERRAVERLSPLVAMIRDYGQWPQKDRESLIRVLRAKGSTNERSYVRGLQAHGRFRAALARIAADGARIGKTSPASIPKRNSETAG